MTTDYATEWLTNVLADSGQIDTIRPAEDVKGDAWRGHLTVKTNDGHEFAIDIREVE